MIDAVVFDLDGVLIETEELWDEVRERLAAERGGRYGPEAQRAMMGMSSLERRRRVSPPFCDAPAAEIAVSAAQPSQKWLVLRRMRRPINDQ